MAALANKRGGLPLRFPSERGPPWPQVKVPFGTGSSCEHLSTRLLPATLPMVFALGTLRLDGSGSQNNPMELIGAELKALGAVS